MRRTELLFLLGLFSSTLSASQVRADEPYRFAFVVEDIGGDTYRLANMIINQMRAQPPFNRMGNQIAFNIIRVNPEAMECHNARPRSSRVMECNTEYISSVGARYGAHKTIAITTSGSCGSSGTIPIVTTLGTPNTGMHELLHAYGMDDEYPSTGDDIRANCNPPRNSVNTASFSPRRNPFASDSEAKSIHRANIPWFSSIGGSTLITTSNQLGTTPSLYPPREAALYRGGGCDSVIPTWRPYHQPTVMSEGMTTDEVLPLYAQAIHAQMSSELGRQIQLLPEAGVAISPSQATDGRHGKAGTAPNEGSKITPKAAGAR